VVKSRKDRAQAKKKKRFTISKDRRKQFVAIFIVVIMVGSALVLLVSGGN
jgi:hypothetical protein